MRVKITAPGVYSDFSEFPRVGAKERDAGDLLTCPDWYALSLVESGLAILVPKVVEMTAPEIVVAEEPQPEERQEKATPDWSDVNATDAAKALAEWNDIDLYQVEGTGKGGRITLADVRLAIIPTVEEAEIERHQDIY